MVWDGYPADGNPQAEGGWADRGGLEGMQADTTMAETQTPRADEVPRPVGCK
jgi:hypothetical protein